MSVNGVVGGLVEAFKANTALFVILAINAAVVGMLFVSVGKAMDAHDKRFGIILEKCIK